MMVRVKEEEEGKRGDIGTKRKKRGVIKGKSKLIVNRILIFF